METLEARIKRFLSLGDDSGSNYGDGLGDGSGYGNGGGNGSGESYGDGYGSGYGNGNGNGSFYRNGSGYGNGNGSGIKVFNGDKVYLVDDTNTIFTSIHGNVAKGYIMNSDLTLTPCYIAKGNNQFAHGKTLHDAFIALQEKLYDYSTEEERIKAFHERFPDYDKPYSNHDLSAYHHVLTGSCKMGRESFCKDKGINLDSKTTVREFVELTKNAYGGDIIKKLPSAYGIK